nr:hypothetical protein OG999_46765 [Streptomyces sp. NBC_00886]
MPRERFAQRTRPGTRIEQLRPALTGQLTEHRLEHGRHVLVDLAA